MKQQIIMHKKTASGYDEIYPDTSIDNILTHRTIADNVGVSDIDGQTVLESISATDKMISGYGTTSGTASAYVVNLVGKESMTPVDGMMIKVKFHVDSNEEPTINVNGSGAKNIFTENGLKVLGTIKTGAWVLLMKSDSLDGWVLQGWCKRRKMYTEIITQTTTWTPPEGTDEITVRLFGGGGGGGHGNSSYGGGGGGGGYMAVQNFKNIPLKPYLVTIGAGGDYQGNGGTTSFDSLLSANGGSSGDTYFPDGGSGGGGGKTGSSSGWGGNGQYGGGGGGYYGYYGDEGERGDGGNGGTYGGGGGGGRGGYGGSGRNGAVKGGDGYGRVSGGGGGGYSTAGQNATALQGGNGGNGVDTR